MKLFTTIHGCSNERKGERTPEYRAFANAKSRCRNPKFTGYKYYGGRGIEFRFESFLELLNEVGLRPSSEHSLDRINTYGHYEKGNVRWSTKHEQSMNTRKHADSISQYRGVSIDKRDGRYRAYVFHAGKQISAGYFSNETEAAKARDALTIKLHGKTAKLNFEETA